MLKKSRKYVVIAKIETDHFVKYRSNDIDKVIKFIAIKHPPVKYINIYSNSGDHKGKLLYTWGKFKGLEPAR
jgi:hypothetical protein